MRAEYNETLCRNGDAGTKGKEKENERERERQTRETDRLNEVSLTLAKGRNVPFAENAVCARARNVGRMHLGVRVCVCVESGSCAGRWIRTWAP